MATTSLADAKNRLSEIVASAERTHERTIVTKNGRPVVAILAIADLEGLLETLDILSHPAEAAELDEAIAEVERGQLSTLDEVAHVLEERFGPGPWSTKSA